MKEQTRLPLPRGTKIDYLGMKATIISDEGGETLEVKTEDSTFETWLWQFEGHTCKVID